MYIFFPIVFVMWSGLTFCIQRIDLYLYLCKILNNSNRRKRSRGQSFLAWFTYRPYADVIPKPQLFLYFANLILGAIATLMGIVVMILHAPLRINQIVLALYLLISAVMWVFACIQSQK
ncbi:MAG: hypothetical protein E7661_10250 [Ruminococcaceae bacterium]|nr:hypothetical protein [Oscillospiraceae bacterium]